MLRAFLFVWALLLCWPAFGGVRVVVPAHDIARGATLSESDLTYSTSAHDVMIGTTTSMTDAVGLQTRRMLRAGEPFRIEDLRRPILVTKGSTVTMTFAVPGIVLTATGRAMSEGGMGETVTVQNPASFRQVMAVVTGPGQVTARTDAGRYASINP